MADQQEMFLRCTTCVDLNLRVLAGQTFPVRIVFPFGTNRTVRYQFHTLHNYFHPLIILGFIIRQPVTFSLCLGIFTHFSLDYECRVTWKSWPCLFVNASSKRIRSMARVHKDSQLETLPLAGDTYFGIVKGIRNFSLALTLTEQYPHLSLCRSPWGVSLALWPFFV